jgi:hypothetical protein
MSEMTFLWWNAQGTDGTDPALMLAIYEYNDRWAIIDGSIPEEDPTIITSAVRSAVLAALGVPESEADVQDGAKAEIEDLPGWAAWSCAQATTWIDTNVTDLASAKLAMKKMACMLVALRNALYPDLQE